MYPKQNINRIKYKEKAFGKEARANYYKEIMRDEPYFPKPLEYSDIDNAFFDFVDKKIDVTCKSGYIPTFTLYSNQRFSEYSQTWKYTDENGNLLLNFKTVSRDTNPEPGDNQGGYWNIPGDRYYTTRIRTVLDENGTESYEIYSMKQPFAIDLMYRINIVSDKISVINEFNEKINKLFASRQYYIRPNGHYIPMVIDSANDESEYSIDERKVFRQTFVIKVMAYIINKDDFKIIKKPKRVFLFTEENVKRKKPTIDITEYEEKIKNKEIELNINFPEGQEKVKFDIDTDVVIENIEKENIRTVRVFVNDTPYYIQNGFSVKNGDTIKIAIKSFDINQSANLKFIGYDPNVTYYEGDVPENVKEEPTKFESINIE